MTSRDTYDILEYEKEQMNTKNLQITDIINAMAQSEPELYGQGNAELMPVKHFKNTELVICNSLLDKGIPLSATFSLKNKLTKIARKDANEMIAFWKDFYSDLRPVND